MKIIKISLAFILLVSLVFVFHTGVQAQEAVTCLRAEFLVEGDSSWGNITLDIDEYGNYQSVTVTPTIYLETPTPVSQITNVRFSYRSLGRADAGLTAGWVQLNDLTFVGNGQGRYQSNSFSFEVDYVGEWEYAIELESGNVAVLGDAAEGCPTAASNYVSFFVSAPELPQDDPMSQSCAFLSNRGFDTSNRFTCTFQGSGYDRLYRDEQCAAGYVVDELGCENGRTYSGVDLNFGSGSSSYCLPCITQAQAANTESAGHLEPCNLALERPCEQVRDLECLPVLSRDREANDITHRCMFTTPTLDRGEACYIGASECNSTAGYTSCQTTNPDNYIGTCENSILGDTGCDFGSGPDDQYCIDTLGDRNAYCKQLVGSTQCEIRGRDEFTEENPAENETGITNYAYATDQFGAANCPNSFATILPTGIAEFVGQVGIQLGQTTLTELTQEEIRDRRINSQPVYFIADPASSDEESREFYQCASCIDNGGTWTGIGCIVTTVQGLFNSLLRIILGVMGGVALIRLIVLGYQYQFAGEDKIKPSVQDIMATLGGLLLVLFSVVILRFIGVNLLDVVPAGFF